MSKAAPYLSMPVIYTPRPGEHWAGQIEMAAIVTRVVDDDTVHLTVLPFESEPFFASNVLRKGVRDDFYCWEPAIPEAPKAPDVSARLDHIDGQIEALAKTDPALVIARLTRRLDEMETRVPPARPKAQRAAKTG